MRMILKQLHLGDTTSDTVRKRLRIVCFVPSSPLARRPFERTLPHLCARSDQSPRRPKQDSDIHVSMSRKEYYRADGVRIQHDPHAAGMTEKYGKPGETDAEGFDPYAGLMPDVEIFLCIHEVQHVSSKFNHDHKPFIRANSIWFCLFD